MTGPGSSGAFTYSWDVTKLAAGAMTQHFATGTTADFTFTPDAEGTYTVQLVVTDAAGGTGQAQAVIDDGATTLVWYGNGVSSGGSGNWNNTTTNKCWMSGGPSGTLVSWGAGDIAVFEGSGGAVTTAGNISVSAIDFESTGYDVQSGGTLSGSGDLTITTSGSGNATIDATVTGSAGMTVSGSGTLTLTNSANSFSQTYINAGTLVFNSGALGSTGPISFGGGTLQWASGNTQDISSGSRISIPSGQTAILSINNNVTLGSLSGGSGGLNKSVPAR